MQRGQIYLYVYSGPIDGNLSGVQMESLILIVGEPRGINVGKIYTNEPWTTI